MRATLLSCVCSGTDGGGVIMSNVQTLKFNGLTARVALGVDAAFIAALETVFAHWAYTLSNQGSTDAFAQVTLENHKYRVSSPFMAEDLFYDDPVNAVCRLVVELAWAQLREHPDMLCLHGAAVEINGRLVVFPSTRKAGKSTLCLGLMAAGNKVFTDDFLPLQINSDDILCGISQGISTRVRLPLPARIGQRTKRFFDRQPFVENAQYRYVAPDPSHAASNAEAAPLGALVYLEQKAGSPPVLEPIDRSEALTALIRQNFSRAANAATILNVLTMAVRTTQCYRLQFDDVDEAVDLINRHFGEWTEPLARISGQDFSPAPAADDGGQIENWQTAQLVRHPGVTESIVDNKRYLSGRNGRSILYLNEGAATIWHLLAEPIDVPEIVGLLQAAYPEQDPTGIRQDVLDTMGSFVGHHLVARADNDDAQIPVYTGADSTRTPNPSRQSANG